MQEPIRPPKRQDPVYSSYAEWWTDQRPPTADHDHSDDKKFSTSFWPYGRRVSAVASSDHQDAKYMLDDRIIHNQLTYSHKRDTQPYNASMSRSQSAGQLFGSCAEALGYSNGFGGPQGQAFGASRSSFGARSLGRSDNSIYPPMARRKRDIPFFQMQPTEEEASRPPSEASTARSREVTMVPPLQRSISQAAPGSTKYEPHRSLREKGFGTRTLSEWRLPQAEDIYRVHDH